MKQLAIAATAAILALALTGCAMGGRREAMQQEFQFEKVDTNGDGSVSRAEFDAFKSRLQGMRRG